jgi:hypothetical protein
MASMLSVVRLAHSELRRRVLDLPLTGCPLTWSYSRAPVSSHDIDGRMLPIGLGARAPQVEGRDSLVFRTSPSRCVACGCPMFGL